MRHFFCLIATCALTITINTRFLSADGAKFFIDYPSKWDTGYKKPKTQVNLETGQILEGYQEQKTRLLSDPHSEEVVNYTEPKLIMSLNEIPYVSANGFITLFPDIDAAKQYIELLKNPTLEIHVKENLLHRESFAVSTNEMHSGLYINPSNVWVKDLVNKVQKPLDEYHGTGSRTMDYLASYFIKPRAENLATDDQMLADNKNKSSHFPDAQ